MVIQPAQINIMAVQVLNRLLDTNHMVTLQITVIINNGDSIHKPQLTEITKRRNSGPVTVIIIIKETKYPNRCQPHSFHNMKY